MHSLPCSPAIPPGLSMHKSGTAGSASCQLVVSAGCSLACPSTICHLAGSACCHLAVSPLHPGCPSLPLFLVWMNVSCLSPWLSDFHTIRISVSSSCFLFLNFCGPSRHIIITLAKIKDKERILRRESTSCCIHAYLPWLLVSAPPTGLDECFFFICLAVGLPYSLIFCQFWLFFVFTLLSFFWFCEEAQCVYLCLHLGRKFRFLVFKTNDW